MRTKEIGNKTGVRAKQRKSGKSKKISSDIEKELLDPLNEIIKSMEEINRLFEALAKSVKKGSGLEE